MNGSFSRSNGQKSPLSRRIVPLLAILFVGVLVSYAIFTNPDDSPSPTDFTAVPITTYTEIVEETKPPARSGVLSEYDQEEIDNIDAFFGPLPVVDQPKTAPHTPVRGLYILEGRSIEHIIDLAGKGYINAAVVDIKEYNGLRYSSKLPLAREIGAIGSHPLAERIQQLKDADVYVVGRIVCFKDILLADAKPDRAIADQQGQVLSFSGEGGVAFLNPYDKRNWEYLFDIAVEAIEMGVDEIQFDYVRFPTGRTTTGVLPYFGDPEIIPTRAQAINRFLETARVEISERYGIPISADVFSTIIGSQLDGEILGQSWRTMGLTGIDSICPMVYPSHYANASSGHYSGNGTGTYLGGQLFETPDLYPYDVTRLALIEGQSASLYGDYATIRPYLQAFTASYLPAGYYMQYDAAAIAQTITAVYDAGFTEWILWSPTASYDEAIFTAEPLQSHRDTEQEPEAP